MAHLGRMAEQTTQPRPLSRAERISTGLDTHGGGPIIRDRHVEGSRRSSPGPREAPPVRPAARLPGLASTPRPTERTARRVSPAGFFVWR